ncbi:uncharacterized protein LOC123313865 [Coccinella septempunctata]|uniref:uncharacterized protein LOC123313865 n=1 Tax=Coccinella septempunctata TaxID=41139 RepID=UPI001D07AC96|nr:uncharacterized protein LOC123313865 [Coccinella septempunctata]
MANFFTRVLKTSFQKKIGPSFNFFRLLTCESGSVSAIPPIIKFTPQLSKIENNWIYQRNEDIRTPFNYGHKIEIPRNFILPLVEDPSENKLVIEPPSEKNDNSIEAARLIVIRRQKMKNHKLKKLRKKLKFVRAKIRQKRELKREKEFQETLIQQCKTAEAFSAEEYVESRIKKYQEALSYVPKETSSYAN